MLNTIDLGPFDVGIFVMNILLAVVISLVVFGVILLIYRSFVKDEERVLYRYRIELYIVLFVGTYLFLLFTR